MRPKDLVALGNLLKLPKSLPESNLEPQIDIPDLMQNEEKQKRKVIKSSPKSRIKIQKDREEKYRKKNEKRIKF